jgi:hypothetical protein
MQHSIISMLTYVLLVYLMLLLMNAGVTLLVSWLLQHALMRIG